MTRVVIYFHGGTTLTAWIQITPQRWGDSSALLIALNRSSHRVGIRGYGPVFISMTLDRFAYEHGITLDYSLPGKPTDNPFIESFNGLFRDECLNTHWFLSLEDDREKIES